MERHEGKWNRIVWRVSLSCVLCVSLSSRNIQCNLNMTLRFFSIFSATLERKRVCWGTTIPLLLFSTDCVYSGKRCGFTSHEEFCPHANAFWQPNFINVILNPRLRIIGNGKEWLSWTWAHRRGVKAIKETFYVMLDDKHHSTPVYDVSYKSIVGIRK